MKKLAIRIVVIILCMWSLLLMQKSCGDDPYETIRGRESRTDCSEVVSVHKEMMEEYNNR